MLVNKGLTNGNPNQMFAAIAIAARSSMCNSVPISFNRSEIMRTPVSRVVLGTSAWIFLLSACTQKDKPLPSEIAPPLASDRLSAIAGPSRGHPDEADMYEISRLVPSYGGHFFATDGTLTAWVTNAGELAAARAALRSLVATRGIRSGTGLRAIRVAARLGDFNFQQLSDWRDRVLELGALPGLVMIDLDEANNRVTLGIDPQQDVVARTTIASRLLTAGIPAAAIRFTPIARPSPASTRRVAPPSDLHAYDYANPLVGGFMYVWQNYISNAVNQCTVGYTARMTDGRAGFVSAAHCSTQMWQPESNQQLGQPSMDMHLGTEFADPTPGTCPALWPCSWYRTSDANFNLVPETPGRPVLVGYVAAPPARIYRWGSPPQGRVLNNAPFLKVTGTTGSIIQGSEIDQVGQVTGWVYGNVQNTCTDYFPDGMFAPNARMVRCAYASDILTNGGDSGGPVFYYMGNGEIVAAGIINAETAGPWGPGTFFSKWTSIANELEGSDPALVGFNILAPVTPTYSATIFGPNEMKPGNNCYWYVSSNFSYTDVVWKADGNTVGTGPELYYSASSSFSLQAQVTNSGSGAGATATMAITVSSGSAQCVVE